MLQYLQQTRPCSLVGASAGLAGGQTCGPSLPGTSMVMLLPLSRIWSSLVMRRPSGVSSLHAGSVVCVQGHHTVHVTTYNSVTSSKTMSGSVLGYNASTA